MTNEKTSEPGPEEAGNRYRQMLDEVASGLGHQFMLELDALVGRRMADAWDGGHKLSLAEVVGRIKPPSTSAGPDELEDLLESLRMRLGRLEERIEAVKDQPRPAPKLDEQGKGNADCPCSRAFMLNQEHHDWLLGFEQRGLVGIMELIRWAESEADSDAEPGVLLWLDLPQFVGLHSWEHPAEVYDLVRFIDSGIRNQEHVFKVGTALESVKTLATTALDDLRER